jgi:formylglycine-generating enzyme required for sulfatase activity
MVLVPGPVEFRAAVVRSAGWAWAGPRFTVADCSFALWVANSTVSAEFRMGSPVDEPGRRDGEASHRRRIGRDYALASKAVTVAQFQRFLKDRPDVRKTYSEKYCPEPECPINEVPWYTAAQYCNWLSQQEGIPEGQWCYPRHADITEASMGNATPGDGGCVE